MQEHPLTGLTAFGIVVLSLGGLLLSPTPALSVSTVEPTRITLATPEPPKQIQPQPPVDDIAPPATKPAEPDSITRRLAEALGLKPEALTLVTVFQVTWPNSCLGCQQPGTECLQVLTPGEQRLYRDSSGMEYDVRVGRNEQFLICAAPQQLTDSASAARSGADDPTSAETETPAGISDAGVVQTPLSTEATRAVADPGAPDAPMQAEQQLAAALTAPATAEAPVAVAAPMEAGVPVAEVTDLSAPSREIMTVVGGLWLLLLVAVVANVWYRRKRSRG
jgi:hypothetical protein